VVLDTEPAVGDKLSSSCELGLAKPVTANGGTNTWYCFILVETADGMQAMADWNGGGGGLLGFDVFPNTATVIGEVWDPNEVCPGDPVDSNCPAEIIVPPGCVYEVTKQVVCVDCDDPNTVIGDPNDFLEMGPGACARFIIEMSNDPTSVKIPRVRVTDDLSCSSWFRGEDWVWAWIDGHEVTDCVRPWFDVGGNPVDFTFAGCRPGDPWVAPGETLKIVFDIKVPDNFSQMGINPDCINHVTVEGFTEVCNEPGYPACAEAAEAEASVNVLVPKVECVKEVAVDYGNDGGIDDGPVPHLTLKELEAADFPLRLIYTYTGENKGEFPLHAIIDGGNGVAETTADAADVEVEASGSAVTPWSVVVLPGPDEDLTSTPGGDDMRVPNICDPLLVQAAHDVGATFGDCELCDDPNDPSTCDGVNDDCAFLGRLEIPPDPASVKSVMCEFTFDNESQLKWFFQQDNAPNDPNDRCFLNVAWVRGGPDYEGICPPPEIPAVSSSCTAEVCGVEPNCPPFVKVMAQIWNENEISFAGTERCIWSWDQRLLSVYTADNGFPNCFLLENLQTNRGRARIDGVRSVAVCGPESESAPLLGVAAKIIDAGPKTALAGLPLFGSGTEAGVIQLIQVFDGGEGTPSPNPGPSDPEGKVTQPCGPGGGGGGTRDPILRANTVKKGSLLVFPKVEIKWDSSGNVIQDTFVTLTNDSNTQVYVQLYFVNGDPAICDWVANDIELTHDEPTYWSVLTGQPKGVSPFTVIGPPSADPDPLNPGGTVSRGYVLAWAINANGDEIRFNHLSGTATIVNYELETAWEYSPWSFQAVCSQEGEPLHDPLKVLELDGNEYDFAPNKLLLDFFAPGATLTSGGGYTVTIEDTDLTVWAAKQDYSQ
jgi:hypothetical protein